MPTCVCRGRASSGLLWSMDASTEIHAGMLAEAEAAFGGSVEIAEDLASLTL